MEQVSAGSGYLWLHVGRKAGSIHVRIVQTDVGASACERTSEVSEKKDWKWWMW